MGERLLSLSPQLEIWKVHLDELREQDLNARAMPKPMFDRLAMTIKRDERLESLPFCALTDKGLEVISGHHRTRAARSARVMEIHVLVDTSGLTPSQIKAKQLAHNAIQGYDDPQLLSQIYNAIEDLDQRLESYVDPDKFELPITTINVPEVRLNLEHRLIAVLLLPYEQDHFDAAVAAVLPELPDDLKTLYLGDVSMLTKFQEATKKVNKEYDIRALGTILYKMACIVLETLGEEAPAPDDEEWLPLRDVVGVSQIPASVGKVLQQAIARMKKDGVLTGKNKWQVLEYLAAEYLAGA